MLRESSIIYSNTNDAALTKQNVALMVAQQMAQLVKIKNIHINKLMQIRLHSIFKWFGNLVTCNWW